MPTRMNFLNIDSREMTCGPGLQGFKLWGSVTKQRSSLCGLLPSEFAGKTTLEAAAAVEQPLQCSCQR